MLSLDSALDLSEATKHQGDTEIRKPRRRKPANRRILRRMALHKLDDLPAYVNLLQQQPTEVESLFNDLLISVTGFFFSNSSCSVMPVTTASRG